MSQSCRYRTSVANPLVPSRPQYFGLEQGSGSSMRHRRQRSPAREQAAGHGDGAAAARPFPVWADLLLPPPRKRRGVAPRSKPRPDRGFRRERLSTSGSGRITGSRRTSGEVRELPRQRTSYPLIETAKLNEIDRLGSPMCANGSCRRHRRHLVHTPNAAGCVLRSPGSSSTIENARCRQTTLTSVWDGQTQGHHDISHAIGAIYEVLAAHRPRANHRRA